MNYKPIIGIEVHVELATASKMFCGCPADHFGTEPNTITCPVCLGLPGALPVPNKKAVEWTILLGLALNCTISEESKFDRKHYFYPDLPKGYQISQYDQPIARNGVLKLKIKNEKLKIEEEIKIRIQRVHLEEDTGKLQHQGSETLVDFNRSGVPLVEIVTEPDFRSVEEVDIFVKKLQQIVRYLGISGADMEKGSMRIEPSISLSIDGKVPNYRVELKNINSFRFVRKALEYEIARQQREDHMQQTRGWSEDKNATVAQREKEEAHDYRYFPEPDIPPIRWIGDQISNIKDQISELPDAKKERFMKEYGLSEYDAGQLTESKDRAEYFEDVVKSQKSKVKSQELLPKTIANCIINKKIDLEKVTPEQLLEQIIQSTAMTSLSDDELEKIIKHVLAENQKAVEDYKKGKDQALMFLVGQAMKLAKGTISPEELKKLLIDSTMGRKKQVRS